MKRNGGYTFIEIMIAMSILIIGIIAIMRMLPIALRESHLAGEQTVAAAYADSQLGRMRSGGSELLAADDLVHPDRYNVGNFQTAIPNVREANALYTGYLTTFQRFENDKGEVELQRVVFTVELPNGRRESFVTYMAKQ